MEGLLHQIFAGLATGGIYASVALALVMIHQATHLLNFAQGEMAMFSTYIAWALINAGVPYWAAFALNLGFSFVVAQRCNTSWSARCAGRRCCRWWWCSSACW